MATKAQKQSENFSEKIVHAYIDYVLTEQKEPASVYAFAKGLKISEAEFYKHFNQFSDIEESIWLNIVNQTVDSLKASKEFDTYSAREKILGFFYTMIEGMNQQRSFFVYSLKAKKLFPRHFKNMKMAVAEFAKEVIQTGMAENEIEERRFISERYHEAVWLNTMFILQFWADDSSKGFEKTDAAIEKTVNLMLELMGKSALDSMLDLGKFLMQNGVRSAFKM